MRRIISSLLFFFLLAAPPLAAWRRWEFVNPRDLEIRVVAESPEIIAGDVATFTIHVRNRTDKTVMVPFATGQRWDAAVFHEGTQIWRWSQGLRWEEAPHEIPIRAGKTEVSPPLTWRSVDRLSRILPQGTYKIRAFLMTQPRFLVSNDTAVKLLPPVVQSQQIVQIALGKHFAVKLPRFIDGREVKWQIQYVYNDYRIHLIERKQSTDETTLIFKPTRTGHVTMHLYAKPMFKEDFEAVERRTIRVEVMGEGWIPLEK